MIGMLTHGGNSVPQHGKIRKGLGLVLGLAQQGGGVEGTHKQDAAFFNDLPCSRVTEKSCRIIRWAATRPRQTTILGCSSRNCSRSHGIQASLSAGSGSRFWGRAALDDVGDIAVGARSRSMAKRYLSSSWPLRPTKAGPARPRSGRGLRPRRAPLRSPRPARTPRCAGWCAADSADRRDSRFSVFPNP